MVTAVLKKFFIVTVPALLLACAWWYLPRLSSLPPEQLSLFQTAPYVVIVTGMLFSFHFHRGRVFSVLLLLALFYWSCRNGLASPAVEGSGRVVLHAFAVLLPLNLTLFCLMREKGVFTTAGRMRLIFLGLQGLVVFWAIRYRYTGLQELLARRFLDLPWLVTSDLPHLAVLAALLGLVVITWHMVVRQNPVDSALLGVLVAVTYCCHAIANPFVPPLFIGTAGMILAMGLIQDSYNMAYRDDLTGLPARRALNQAMHGLGRRYTIAMLDVDHFKRFNDTYGHDVGDQVLKMVAGRMELVTGGGRPFRYGGEEFTVLFSRKTADEALPHLEALRKAIAEYQVWIRSEDRPKRSEEGEPKRGKGGGKQAVSVTISIGVAQSCDQLRTPQEVMKAADKALYRAKNAGRNRVSK